MSYSKKRGFLNRTKQVLKQTVRIILGFKTIQRLNTSSEITTHLSGLEA